MELLFSPPMPSISCSSSYSRNSAASCDKSLMRPLPFKAAFKSVDFHGEISPKCVIKSSICLCNRPKPVSVRRVTVWACSKAGAAAPDPLVNKFSHFKDAFWRFLRPHTIRGTALGSTALVARALIENPNLIQLSLVLKAVSGLLALICGNGYIVGINQIYDIGIDKVNKPYLPIAAGDLSVQSAWVLVLAFAVAGLATVALNFGPFISSLYSLGLFLGTIYSVPPFRMKRFPVAAFLIIATVRGFLLNFGVYYATRAALGLTFEWSSPVVFITTFVTLFALVIAITKDLPDVEGDRKYQISTLATKLGVRNIAFLGSGLLLVNYVGSILAAIYMPQAFRRGLMIPAHTILALGLIFQVFDSNLSVFHCSFMRLIFFLNLLTPRYFLYGLILFLLVATICVKTNISRKKLRDWDIIFNIKMKNYFLIPVAWILEKANYTKEAISGFYRFIWNLFYIEYIIFPFI